MTEVATNGCFYIIKLVFHNRETRTVNLNNPFFGSPAEVFFNNGWEVSKFIFELFESGTHGFGLLLECFNHLQISLCLLIVLFTWGCGIVHSLNLSSIMIHSESCLLSLLCHLLYLLRFLLEPDHIVHALLLEPKFIFKPISTIDFLLLKKSFFFWSDISAASYVQWHIVKAALICGVAVIDHGEEVNHHGLSVIQELLHHSDLIEGSLYIFRVFCLCIFIKLFSNLLY